MVQLAARREFGLPPAAALFIALAGLGAHVFAAEQPPHIVLFLADDLGWSDSSVYRRTDAATPNMERLAAAGMTFTHAFVASPSCAPSRAALLTGLSPPRNGAMFNHTLPDRTHRRWPAWFKELGYEVVAFGKVAHYDTVREYGFDHASHFNYHQDDCIEAAIAWLAKRKSEKPLCLLVGTNWPHVPWPKETTVDPNRLTLPPTQVDTRETRAARARYLAAVELADRDLGLVYDAARKHLGDNVLFFFSSDHGAQIPFAKWSGYDAGIRTPLIAVWPGKIAAGARSDAMVSWIDLLPTCLEATGATPPDSGPKPGQISGKSFLPVLQGKQTERRERIFVTHSGDQLMNQYPLRAVRSRQWKYIRNLSPEAEHHSHIDLDERADSRVYWSSWVRLAETDAAAAAAVSRYHKRPAEELYDLAADPWERVNLAADPAQAERLQAFRKELDDWMRENGDEGLATENLRRPKPRGKSQN